MNPIKKRNMWAQVGLMFITFGLYWVYWFYQTAQELKYTTKNAEATPTLWTILLFVPFGALYSYYCYAELYEKVASERMSKWIIYILWLCFAPAVWFLVQRDLNRMADAPITV